jgi:hypothetical protein
MDMFAGGAGALAEPFKASTRDDLVDEKTAFKGFERNFFLEQFREVNESGSRSKPSVIGPLF